MRSIWLALALSVSACGNDNPTTASSSPTTSSVVAPASASGAIGVSECDEYVTRMRACIANAPEEEREQRTKSVDEIESTWKRQAAAADTKERMVTACKASLAGLESSPGCKPASSVESPTLTK